MTLARQLSRCLALMVFVGVAQGEEPLYRLILDQPNLKRWRRQSNCTFTPAPGDRGGAIAWKTQFGKFSFGWATHTLAPRVDFTKAGRVCAGRARYASSTARARTPAKS